MRTTARFPRGCEVRNLATDRTGTVVGGRQSEGLVKVRYPGGTITEFAEDLKITLQPLLARNRYSDDEWRLASAGKCDWETELGMHPRILRCEQPSSPDSFYRFCAEHDEQARDESPNYGR